MRSCTSVRIYRKGTETRPAAKGKVCERRPRRRLLKRDDGRAMLRLEKWNIHVLNGANQQMTQNADGLSSLKEQITSILPLCAPHAR